jgi:hypothetical protein
LLPLDCFQVFIATTARAVRKAQEYSDLQAANTQSLIEKVGVCSDLMVICNCLGSACPLETFPAVIGCLYPGLEFQFAQLDLISLRRP